MPHVFAAALLAYQAEAALRGRCVTDEEIEAVDARVEEKFDAMLATPARTPTNAAAKGRAILSEWGETGEVRCDLVEALIADVATLH